MDVVSRYFFNSTSRSCESFSYNGCSGSGNRFTTRSDCQDICETTTTTTTTTGSSKASSGSSKASSGSTKAASAGSSKASSGSSSAGLVAAEAVIGTAVILLSIAAVVLGVRYAKTAGICAGGSYKRFFDIGGSIGILRRDRDGSTSSRRERALVK